MSNDVSKELIQREIDAKKKKLEELKAKRQARQATQTASAAAAASDASGTPSAIAVPNKRLSTIASSSSIAGDQTTPRQIASTTTNATHLSSESLLDSVASLIGNSSSHAATAASSTQQQLHHTNTGASLQQRLSALRITHPTPIDLPSTSGTAAPERITYTQQCQTDESSLNSNATRAESPLSSKLDPESEEYEIRSERDLLRRRELELLASVKTLQSQVLTLQKQSGDAALNTSLSSTDKHHTRMTAQQIATIENTSEFKLFFERTSKMMERLLGQQSLITSLGTGGAASSAATATTTNASSMAATRNLLMSDFTRDPTADDADETSNTNNSNATTAASEDDSLLQHRLTLSDPMHTQNRPVSSIDWSPRHPELLLASYASLDDALMMDSSQHNAEQENEMNYGNTTNSATNRQQQQQHDGCVLVWNACMSNRAEYSCLCDASVLRAWFDPSAASGKLILATTHTGQVMLWDMRTGRRTPVARTALAASHSAPVYASAMLPIVKQQSSHQGLFHIVTASRDDGCVAVWSEHNWSAPQFATRVRPNQKLLSQYAAQLAASAATTGVSLTSQHMLTTSIAAREELTMSCLDFPPRDVLHFVAGSDEGHIYKAKLYDLSQQSIVVGSGSSVSSSGSALSRDDKYTSASLSALSGNGGMQHNDASSGSIHTQSAACDTLAYDTVYQAHDAPITQLTFQPQPQSNLTNGASNAPSLTNYYLTSSYDWTVKLWQHTSGGVVQNLSAASTASAQLQQQSASQLKSGGGGAALRPHGHTPLHVFDSSRDYVYDVQWHPQFTHAFASADGNGRIDLYDLTRGFDVPRCSTVATLQSGASKDAKQSPAIAPIGSPQRGGGGGATPLPQVDTPGAGLLSGRAVSAVAVSRLAWNRAGTMLAAGTSLGKLELYECNSQLLQASRDEQEKLHTELLKKASG